MASKNLNKMFCTVFTENGYHKLMLPDGTVVPHQVESVVTNEIEKSRATITVACNVVATKEDAFEIYLNKE